jgi:transglutaminase-like putative cysteine protease
MDQNLEAEFRKASQNLAKKNREQRSKRLLLHTMAFILLGFGLAFLLWLHRTYRSQLVAHATIPPAWLFLLAIAGILTFLAYKVKLFKPRDNRQSSSSPTFGDSRLSPGRWLDRFQLLGKKRLLGYTALGFTLLYLNNPSLFSTPAGDLVVQLRYNPLPPSLPSPWPWQGQDSMHPLIRSIPASAEKSIASVAFYISSHEKDPYQQIKAIHDYVIHRLTYDFNVLASGIRPSQEAKAVFASRIGVCEGYANLFTALAQAIGLDVATVDGEIRRELAPKQIISGVLKITNPGYNWTRHAWNVAKINGHWYPVDTTWDDKGSNDEKDNYSSDYLLLPPAVMIASHLPDQQGWQLLEKKLSKKAFEEQVLLNPQFFKESLQLLSPKRYNTKVKGQALIAIRHPSNFENDILAL